MPQDMTGPPILTTIAMDSTCLMGDTISSNIDRAVCHRRRSAGSRGIWSVPPSSIWMPRGKRIMTATIGHQGHPGRFVPWCWVQQCGAYFASQDMSWKDMALYRDAWQAHRSSWVMRLMGHKRKKEQFLGTSGSYPFTCIEVV